MRRDQIRDAEHIAILTKTHDVDPELGHQLRTAAYKGEMTYREARKAIALLQQLPRKEK